MSDTALDDYLSQWGESAHAEKCPCPKCKYKRRIIELKFTRKEAKTLLHIALYCTNWYCGDTVTKDFSSCKRDKLKFKKTLLNKLKRAGVK